MCLNCGYEFFFPLLLKYDIHLTNHIKFHCIYNVTDTLLKIRSLCMYVYVRTVCVRICIYMYVWMCVCIYVYIYIYEYICIHICNRYAGFYICLFLTLLFSNLTFIIDLVYTYFLFFPVNIFFFLLRSLSLTPSLLIYEQLKCTVSKCKRLEFTRKKK